MRTYSTPAASKLSSLLEREESPETDGPMNIDAIVSPPKAPPNTVMTVHTSKIPLQDVSTPQTASRVYPSMVEMHPSKVHHSTTKQEDSGLRCNVEDAEPRTASASRFSGMLISEVTPSKSRGSLPSHMSSPGFEFSFTRPDSDLSIEAQKIMDSVREEAARIKAQLHAERDKQAQEDGPSDQFVSAAGRKIATPKGKAGRYSDVHRQQFKKMDSIVSHASTWKNNIQSKATSLKRTNSKAGLDTTGTGKSLSRANSSKSLHKPNDSGRLENTAPGKRAKQRYEDDTSTARPISRDNSDDSKITTPVKIASKPTLPSAVTTPTKSSLARASSMKHPKMSMIPSLSRSHSTKSLASPVAAETEGSNKYLSSLSRFGSMRSILHRPQPKFSDDPAKVAAGTHLPTPKIKANADKDLSELPVGADSSPRHTPTMKHVDFTTSTKSRYELAVASPSPSKISATHVQNDSSFKSLEHVPYPSIPHNEEPLFSPGQVQPQSLVPGDFTFRSANTMNFGPKISNIPSSTIRQVRPSGITTPVPSFHNIPSIPHGLPNKKRHHNETDSEDNENAKPVEATKEEGPKTKRMKSAAPEKVGTMKLDGLTGYGGSRIPKPGGKEKKGVLSLSRLNMLARPKERR